MLEGNEIVVVDVMIIFFMGIIVRAKGHIYRALMNKVHNLNSDEVRLLSELSLNGEPSSPLFMRWGEKDSRVKRR